MNRKSYLLSSLLTALFSIGAVGQNLVPNPGFETFQNCPSGPGQLITLAPPWATNSIATPEYFNSCAGTTAGTGFGIPYNNYGYQQASSGNGYAGFFAYSAQFANVREFVIAPLSTPLTVGTKYYVKFKVSPAYRSTGNPSVDPLVAVSNLGLMFSNTAPGFMSPMNNADVFTTSVVSDTAVWTTISGSYIATNNSQYVVIGNLFQDASTQLQGLGPAGTNGASYYYLDEVCVSTDSMDCINMPVGIQTQLESENVSVYPNPAGELLNITLKNPFSDNIRISNTLGQELYYLPNTNGMTRFTIDLSGYTAGMYIVTLGNAGEQVHKRFVKSQP